MGNFTPLGLRKLNSMGSWCTELSDYMGGWCQRKLNFMGGWVKKKVPSSFFLDNIEKIQEKVKQSFEYI